MYLYISARITWLTKKPDRATACHNHQQPKHESIFIFIFGLFQPEHWVPVHVGGLVGEPKLDIFGEGENLLLKFLLF